MQKRNQIIISEMKMLQLIGSLFFMLIFISSCQKKNDVIVDGMAPIYIYYDDFTSIKTLAPQPYIELSKIVTQGNFIYLTEVRKGIHVVDNSDPTHPLKAYFWQIPGNTEFTIKENILYANLGPHLSTIDISNPADIKFVSILKNQYPLNLEVEEYPLNFRGQFECYSPEKGILAGWIQKKLTNPLCRTK